MRGRFDNDSAYRIGVDIGGTKVLIVIAEDEGDIIIKEKIRTSPDINEIIKAINTCIKNSNIPNQRIDSMGVGVPGMVDSKEGIVIDSPSLKWRELKLRQILEQCYQFPIVVKNDVNLAVIGERWFGGNHNDNIFYIAVGTGVGSAIIANGQIVEGSCYSAGEIGYVIGKEDIQLGRTNNSLEFGTFEQKVSGTALALKGAELGYTPPELFLQYQDKNPKVIPIIKDFTLELSLAIANVVSLLNPEIIIIGGGVAQSLDCIIDEIRYHTAKLTPIAVRIELSKLGGEAGALGGIAYFLEQSKSKGRVKNE